MTDDEYKEYLVALARRHLSSSWLLAPGPNTMVLGHDIDRLSSVCRFLWAVRDRPENAVLLKELAQELRNVHLQHVLGELERSGVLAALDELPEITFGELRRAAVPPEDARLLANAGIADPEAEITITIHYARRKLRDNHRLPSERVQEAVDELKRAADRIEQMATPAAQPREPSNEAPAKKRKLFGGIGKVLTGTIAAAGNLALATGAVVAPNPAIVYGVLGSAAMAIGSICQGIGDLRGE